MAEKVIVDGVDLEIEGDGYNPRGKFKFIRGKRTNSWICC